MIKNVHFNVDIYIRELYSEIENKKEYEFLRGNKELESIFEEHLK